MIETYLKEQKARTKFVYKAQHEIIAALAHPGVERALGSSVANLSQMAESLYIPNISQHGMMSIPVGRLGMDALPVIALREGEEIVRDHTFATFAPRQYSTTPDQHNRFFDTVTERTKGLPQQEFVTGFIEPTPATVRRMMHGIPEFPKPGSSMYFNMRPLLILPYTEGGDLTSPDKTGTALAMANYVMNNAVVITPGPEGFEAINEQWSTQSAFVEQAIRAATQGA